MRIAGRWYRCADGVIRPVFFGEVESVPGIVIQCPFLVDTGADFTVLSKATLDALRTDHLPPSEPLVGVGGFASSVDVDAKIWLFRDGAERILFGGRFAAATDARALDMSVLGRDILDRFALIVGRPGSIVCLVNQRHGYSITSR